MRGGTGRAHGHWTKRRAGALTAGIAALLALSACTSSGGNGPGSTGGGTSNPTGSTSTPGSSQGSTVTQPPVAPAAVITAMKAAGISPTKPVSVSVAGGTLTSVVMKNVASGVEVKGTIAGDGKTWHNTEDLGYSKTYRITATAKNADGKTVVKHSTITTLTPNNQTQPYIDDLYGSAIQQGGKYGVAMVVNVDFDEDIPDKAAAERALQVTTSPHVEGAWSWNGTHSVHWRPEHYYPAGTKVTVNAKVYGVDLGDGLYGQSDVSTSFVIGRKQLTIANDTAPKSVNKVRVYNAAGHVIRTMNTSMGTHGGETINGNYINFYTLDGTYTVLGHENPASMCSDSYGLPANAPGGYGCENIPWSTKISTDGIYLHELDATTWAQNSGQDVSHGCLNLDYDNAHWFYTHSLVGDPVVVHGAKGAPTLQLWEGGDWTLSWQQWLAGSALHS